jgi:hypothetical protein
MFGRGDPVPQRDDVHGHADLRVAEDLHHHARIHPLLGHLCQCCRTVDEDRALVADRSSQRVFIPKWYQKARTRDGGYRVALRPSIGAGSGSRDAYRMPVVDLLGQFTDPGAAVVDVHAERQRRVTTPEPGVLRGEEVERERLGLTCAQAVVV